MSLELESESLFDVKRLRGLIDEMERSGIDELEVAEGASRLFIRRGTPEMESATSPPSRRLPTLSHHPAARDPDLAPVTAPLTGMFYSRPQPGDPPYVTPGGRVERGQIVALIETMKLFNEVTSEVSGTVVSVVASEGGLVEVGQPLLFVRLENEGSIA